MAIVLLKQSHHPSSFQGLGISLTFFPSPACSVRRARGRGANSGKLMLTEVYPLLPFRSRAIHLADLSWQVCIESENDVTHTDLSCLPFICRPFRHATWHVKSGSQPASCVSFLPKSVRIHRQNRCLFQSEPESQSPLV